MSKTVTIDGVSCELIDQTSQIIERALSTRDAQIATLTTAKNALDAEMAEVKKKKGECDAIIATKDAEIVTLKSQVADASNPAKLDQLVRDRAVFVGKARQILGQALVVDGKTNIDICKQVVDAKVGTVASGWNNDQIMASFHSLTANLQANDGSSQIRSAFANPAVQANMTDADKAYAEMCDSLANAWKGATKAA